MRVTLIHNPGSGDASPSRELLMEMFIDVEEVDYATTDTDWRAVLDRPGDLVVAVGGDGTVGPVLAALVGSKRQVAVLPTGTANNIADTLGIVGDARDLIRAWSNGPFAPFDIWQLTSGETTAFMVEAMGGGFFATCIERDHELEPPTYIVGDPRDRAYHLLRERLADEPPRSWTITIDGEDHSGTYIGIEVMNGPLVGPNIELAADAMPGDGLLDVVLIGPDDRSRLRACFDVDRRDRLPLAGALTVIRAREVDLAPPPGAALHLDGERWRPEGADGAEIEIRHAGATLVHAPSTARLRRPDRQQAEAGG